MKELSIEEKAMAYDKAIERAKELLYVSDKESLQCKTIESVLPELKEEESEDEKIRKFLIDFIKVCRWSEKEDQGWPSKEDCIVWLEKQGEHANFRSKIQVGDRVTRNEDGVLVNLSQLDRVAKKHNITGIGSKNAQGKLGEMIKNLKPVNEILEQKPAEWSKEDVDIINGIIIDYEGEIEHLSNSTIDEQAKPVYQERIDFLNRLKSLRPVKQEWSEEDERLFESVVWHLRNSVNNGDMEHSAGQLEDWLNAHHFDYRGLIEKGLAFEAPTNMYNIKITMPEEIFSEFEMSEDEGMIKSIIGYLKECRNNTRSEVMIDEYAKWIRWLKKQWEFLKSFKPQPKQEPVWSEEDNNYIDNCCLLIGAVDDTYDKIFKDNCIHYLQSLKERFGESI